MSLKLRRIFKNIILIEICILNTISLAFGDCRLRLPQDISLQPNILLTVGSHQVGLNLKKTDTIFNFFEHQEIQLICNTKFKYPERLDTENKIILKCEGGSYSERYGYSSETFECSSQKWNLYETFQNFAWCPSNTTSYLLARPIDSESAKFQYLAGICYETSSLSFKSLYYTIAPKHSEHLHPRALSKLYTPGLELKYVKQTFGIKSVTETDYETPDIVDWMKYSKYNYSSIIQNALLLNDFNDELGSILDLVWWPNLRLGNWKRYEAALAREVESHDQSYDILAGVSAVAAVPIIQTCQTNYTLKELVDNKNNKISMYVWNYLRSPNNSSDEIVIIGFNSPFYEFYSEKDVVFCQDKCQEVPWLKKVSSTFRYSALGVIFCCSSEEILSSRYLDGFPKASKPQETVTVNPTTIF